MIKYINNDTVTIISELEPEHQCILLQLIGESLRKEKVVQYQFNEALKAFTILSPSDKREEIDSWINVMKGILSEESKTIKI